MRLTTLCYIKRDDSYLMMHRNKKLNDENAGKWIGIGGHIKENESPDECIRREIKEETGLKIFNLRLRGIITFILPDWGNELTFLYTADTDDDISAECAEGDLKWIPMADVLSLPLWEGDRIFLPMLDERDDCFSLKLEYEVGGKLASYAVE